LLFESKAAFFMKRSKLLLGITAALLSIAGVAAAKHYSGSRTAYYCTHGNNWCTSVTIPCTMSGTIDYLYTTVGQHRINVYTLGPVGAGCNPINPTKCLHKVTYNGIM
jgi:hypothetical protein